MPASTITSKGQITIPKRVRERLGLNPGDRLIFRFDEEGQLLVSPEALQPLGRVPGLLHHLAGEEAASPAEMDESVRGFLREKYDKAVRR